jgi:hypothetical protein
MTRPSSEPYYRRHRLPPTRCSRRPTSTSPPTNELRTSSEERSLRQRRHDATRTSNPTSAGRRGLVKRSTLPDRPPLAPEADLAEANERWTTSSTPSARTTRTCATPSRTAGISSTPSGTADPSNLYRLPHREEDWENHNNPSSRRREEEEPSRTSTEKSTSSSADTGHKKARDNKSSTIVRYWWRPPVLPPRTDGLSTRSPSPGQISGSTPTNRCSHGTSNRVPEVRGGKLRLRIQRHHRETQIGEVHGYSTLYIHDIEDARTTRDHNCARCLPRRRKIFLSGHSGGPHHQIIGDFFCTGELKA